MHVYNNNYRECVSCFMLKHWYGLSFHPEHTAMVSQCHSLLSLCSYTFVQYSVSKNVLSSTVSGTVSSSHITLLPQLTNVNFFQGYAATNLPLLDYVKIVGVPTKPSTVQLNGKATSNFTYDDASQVLEVDDIGLHMDSQFSIMWS